MLSDPVFLLAAIVAVTLVGLAKGGFAGVGTAATPLLALLVPPLQAAAVLLPILLVQDAISVWAYRREWSAWNLKVMMPGAVIGIAVAWLFAAHVSDAVVRVIVGLIGVAYVLNAWFGRPPHAAHRPTAARGVFWGGLAGFTSTLIQAGSPPFQVFTLPQRLDKMTFVGTNAIFFAAINLMKLVPYSALDQFTSRTLTASALLLPLAIATNFLGIWLVRVTPAHVFFRIAHVLMFCICLELTRRGAVDLLYR